MITNLINKHFGKESHRMIHPNVVKVNEKEVCIIEIGKSPNPVFIKKGEKEEFFIRAAAASIPLSISETADYVRSHFKVKG